MKAIILTYDGLEECEALNTYDLLFRSGIDTLLVGNQKEIISSHNIVLKTDLLIDEVDPDDYDCLILPGGLKGTANLKNDPKVIELIKCFNLNNKLIAAICAAPSILLDLGLLTDNNFTCFPGFEGNYKANGLKAFQYKNIITGKGLGASFEFAALIIENLLGKEKAKEILAKIQY